MINLTTKEIKGYTSSSIAKSEKKDCFVRALAAGFEINYNDAHAIAKDRFNREDKKGTKGHEIISGMKEIEESGIVLGDVIAKVKVLKGLDIKNRYKLYGELIDRKKTVKSFIKDHPKGNYIVTVSKHAFVVKDGKLIDNVGEEFRPTRKVDGAYKILLPTDSSQLSLFN
tara:strand:- start:102 stop:611 length:510 start_codon:yes stop_codon:yes gene_type:complete